MTGESTGIVPCHLCGGAGILGRGPCRLCGGGTLASWEPNERGVMVQETGDIPGTGWLCECGRPATEDGYCLGSRVLARRCPGIPCPDCGEPLSIDRHCPLCETAAKEGP